MRLYKLKMYNVVISHICDKISKTLLKYASFDIYEMFIC